MRLNLYLTVAISLVQHCLLAQNTASVFIQFDDNSFNEIQRISFNSIDKLAAYPMDFERTFIIRKQTGGYIQDLRFTFSPIPDLDGTALKYSILPLDDLDGIVLDQNWFNSLNYKSIISSLREAKTIYLFESERVDMGNVMVLEVKFSFDAEE